MKKGNDKSTETPKTPARQPDWRFDKGYVEFSEEWFWR